MKFYHPNGSHDLAVIIEIHGRIKPTGMRYMFFVESRDLGIKNPLVWKEKLLPHIVTVDL